MRPCDETLDLISAALDGTLTPEEQSALDAHLAQCPACSALYTDLMALHTASSELEEVPAPDGFAAQVMAQIAAHPAQESADRVIPFPARKPKTRSPWKGWTATAAAVAIVALGAFALSGQLGATKNASFDAMPAQAESALVMDACSEAQFQYADQSASQSASDTAETVKEHAVLEDTVDGSAVFDQEMSASSAPPQNESMAPAATAEPDSFGLADLYCGTLTVTADSSPEGLNEYEFELMDDGTLHYVVPADYFFSLEGTESFRTNTPAKSDQAAEYGLIIVTPAS